MTKVLPGISHHVLSWMRERWVDLVQISLVPLAIVVVVTALQASAMRGIFEMVLAFETGGAPDPAVFGRIMQTYGLMALGGLLSVLAFIWLYVRIVRLYALGEKDWIALDGAVLKATGMTLLYGIGIYFLTMAAYVAGLFALIMPAAIIGAVFADEQTAGLVISVIAVFGVIAILALLTWFSCRFLVGLPAVALGRSPDFFRDMWALSKGESWALPARLVLAYLALMVVLLPVFGLFLWPAIEGLIAVAEQGEGGQLPASAVSGLLDAILPMQAVFLALQLPWIWFTVLLFTEAYRRFAERPASS